MHGVLYLLKKIAVCHIMVSKCDVCDNDVDDIILHNYSHVLLSLLTREEFTL